MADGGPSLPRDRGRPRLPVRPLRRGRRVHRPGAGPSGHRHLRVARADRGHRPGLGAPGDRDDRRTGRGGARRLDQVTLRHLRGNPRGPAGRAGRRPDVQPGPAGRAGLRPAAPRRRVRDPDRGPCHRAGRRPGQRPVRGHPAGAQPVLHPPWRDRSRSQHPGPHRQTPDEPRDARPGPGADRVAGGPVPPGPDRRPDLRHRPSRQLLAAAPGRGLDDHQRTARRAGAGLRCPQPASGPRRTRPARRKAAVDEAGHRGTRLQNGQPTTAAAMRFQTGASLDGRERSP